MKGDRGKSLLGTEIGTLSARLIAIHKNQIGLRVITKVSVFATPSSRQQNVGIPQSQLIPGQMLGRLSLFFTVEELQAHG